MHSYPKPYLNCSGNIPAPYNSQELYNCSEGADIYITESPIETISLAVLLEKKIRDKIKIHVVGSTGANFKTEWIDIFVRKNLHPIIAYNNDNSGAKRSEKLCKDFKEKNIKADKKTCLTVNYNKILFEIAV